MPATLTQAQTIVAAALDDPLNQYFSLTQLANWINEGCLDVARRSQTLQKLGTVPVVALTAQYTMPADLLSIHRVEFVPTGAIQTYPVTYRSVNDMDQVWGVNQSSPNTYPQFYTPWNSPPNLTIQLFPVPSQTGTLNIWYYRIPVTAVSPTDNLDVVEGFQTIVYLYAEYMAKRKSADPTWQEAKQLYEQEFQDLVNKTRSYTDQMGTFTTGPGWMPYWLYEGGE